ncbi:MAG: hypothetical protein H7338_05060 [Candidatus Sericytochromatia bacterium]|nr:hypothetical protein [Candidatus Sericytochromatia bacterium]
MYAHPTRRILLAGLGLLLGLTVAGCRSDGAATATPGTVRASQPPFDATTLSARYVDRCVKDGGTMAQCGCQFSALSARLTTDQLSAVVTGMEAGGPAAVEAYRRRQEVASSCR